MADFDARSQTTESLAEENARLRRALDNAVAAAAVKRGR